MMPVLKTYPLNGWSFWHATKSLIQNSSYLKLNNEYVRVSKTPTENKEIKELVNYKIKPLL
jgi:hypothetical protein